MGTEFSGAFLSALISLLIGGLLGREIFRILDKPNVIIQYRNVTEFRQEDGIFLSMRVGNVGRSAAANCICTLTIFELPRAQILNPKKAASHENLPEYKEENLDLEFPRMQIVTPESQHDIVSESLCWSSLGNPAEVNINPGTTQTMDICKFLKKDSYSYFIFPSEFGWKRVRIRISAAEKIRGRLLICPSNDYPTPLDFVLGLNEQGHPIFSPLKIGLIDRIKRAISKRTLYAK